MNSRLIYPITIGQCKLRNMKLQMQQKNDVLKEYSKEAMDKKVKQSRINKNEKHFLTQGNNWVTPNNIFSYILR